MCLNGFLGHEKSLRKLLVGFSVQKREYDFLLPFGDWKIPDEIRREASFGFRDRGGKIEAVENMINQDGDGDYKDKGNLMQDKSEHKICKRKNYDEPLFLFENARVYPLEKQNAEQDWDCGRNPDAQNVQDKRGMLHRFYKNQWQGKNKDCGGIREDNLTDSRRGAHMDKIQRKTDYAVGKNQREKSSENADKNPARNCPVHVHIKGVAAYQEKGGGD